MLEARLLPVRSSSWHRGRRSRPAQGRTLAPSCQGFIVRGRMLSVWSLPGRNLSPLHTCVPAYVCHLANLSQSQGSDKNAAARARVRVGVGIEGRGWGALENGMKPVCARRVATERANLQGVGRYGDTQNSCRPELRAAWQRAHEWMLVCSTGGRNISPTMSYLVQRATKIHPTVTSQRAVYRPHPLSPPVPV